MHKENYHIVKITKYIFFRCLKITLGFPLIQCVNALKKNTKMRLMNVKTIYRSLNNILCKIYDINTYL